MQVHVGEQRRDHCSLRRTQICLRPLAVLRYSRLEPFLDQAEHPPIGHPMLDELHRPFLAHVVEEATDAQLPIPFAVSGHTYNPRRASSASSASWSNPRTSSGLFSGFWPRKSPSLTKLFTAAWAPPSLVEVGRMIATGPNFGFRK